MSYFIPAGFEVNLLGNDYVVEEEQLLVAYPVPQPTKFGPQNGEPWADEDNYDVDEETKNGACL